MDKLCGIKRFTLTNPEITMDRTIPIGTLMKVSIEGNYAYVITKEPPNPLPKIPAVAWRWTKAYLHFLFENEDDGYLTETLNFFLKMTLTKYPDFNFQKQMHSRKASERESISSILFEAVETTTRYWLNRSKTSLSEYFRRHPKYASRSQRKDLWQTYWENLKEEALTVVPVLRYKKSHCNRIRIPYSIRQVFEWAEHQPIGIFERDDGSYLVKKATEEEQKYLYYKRDIIEDGTVRGGKYLYFTKSQKEALGIGVELYDEGVNLKCTFDIPYSKTITIEPLTEEEKETLPKLKPARDNGLKNKTLTVQRHVNGPFILPSAFCKIFDIHKDDTLKTEIVGHKLIIHGKQTECDICGKKKNTVNTTTLSICQKCADTVPTVREKVKENGCLGKAVLMANQEIETAQMELEKAKAKLKKFIEMGR